MAVDLSALQTNSVNISGLAGAAIALITPNLNTGIKPQIKPGSSQSQPSPLLFHIEDENTVTLTSDITDHYAEDNTSIQDQIALKPEVITVTGFIGELNDVVPPLLQPLKTAADKLTLLGPYQPVLSASALIAYNQAVQTYAIAALTVNTAISAIQSIAGSGENIDPATGKPFAQGFTFPSQNKQQQMFTSFYAYWSNRNLFTVQTPWAIFTDMAIQTIRSVQDADTRVISSFEVTFKKMRFAQLSVAFDVSNVTGRLQQQAASEVNHGVIQGTPAGALSARIS